ncbi:hypothetical protein [Streptomyces vietnamensis]|uniref:hypothetical protein n=1 Tax=Streptomyces vietnamensis TaxID=362257 RepID=UPI000698FBF4|nr:hypothetical protein [Streptomyces vietnamensis]
MADERYQWLDQEAAERLLRGEPVEALDDRARFQAERLAEALGTARVPAVPPAARTELPGEAAALAAFRKATAERAAAASAVSASAATAASPAATASAASAASAGRAAVAELGRVRLAPVTAPARRWGRSVRYGLAAAVAAVTVGGVAVAAGTGVLPLVGPAPASSVTAVETTDPLVSEEPGIRQDPEAPPTEPGGGDPTPGSSPSADSSSTAPTPGVPDGHGTVTPGTGTPKPGRTPSTGGGTTSTDPRGKALDACRAYRKGVLDAAGRQRITNALRKGETLGGYCDRILSGDTGTSTAGGQNGSNGNGNGKGDGKGDSEDPSDGDHEGGSNGTSDGGANSGSEGNSDSGPAGVGNRAGSVLPDAQSQTGVTVTLPAGITAEARLPLAV